MLEPLGMWEHPCMSWCFQLTVKTDHTKEDHHIVLKHSRTPWHLHLPSLHMYQTPQQWVSLLHYHKCPCMKAQMSDDQSCLCCGETHQLYAWYHAVGSFRSPLVVMWAPLRTQCYCTLVRSCVPMSHPTWYSHISCHIPSGCLTFL